ncbi:hypothetical protein FHY19_003576 [Xanthomonas arboricola]|nr:hypothetical protein [Xanthomonas sp. 4461]
MAGAARNVPDVGAHPGATGIPGNALSRPGALLRGGGVFCGLWQEQPAIGAGRQVLSRERLRGPMYVSAQPFVGAHPGATGFPGNAPSRPGALLRGGGVFCGLWQGQPAIRAGGQALSRERLRGPIHVSAQPFVGAHPGATGFPGNALSRPGALLRGGGVFCGLWQEQPAIRTGRQVLSSERLRGAARVSVRPSVGAHLGATGILGNARRARVRSYGVAGSFAVFGRDSRPSALAGRCCRGSDCAARLASRYAHS